MDSYPENVASGGKEEDFLYFVAAVASEQENASKVLKPENGTTNISVRNSTLNNEPIDMREINHQGLAAVIQEPSDGVDAAAAELCLDRNVSTTFNRALNYNLQQELKRFPGQFMKGKVTSGSNEALEQLLNFRKEEEAKHGTHGVLVSSVNTPVDGEYCVDVDGSKGQFWLLNCLKTGSFEERQTRVCRDKTSKKLFVSVKTQDKLRLSETVRDIQHQNIVTFYGLVIQENRLEILLEFAGKPLLHYVEGSSCTPFSEDTIWLLLKDAVDALVYLSEKDITQRQITPSSVFIKSQDTKLVLKIENRKRMPNEFRGLVLPYASPETCRALRRESSSNDEIGFSPRSNVFELAMVVFYMYTRKHVLRESASILLPATRVEKDSHNSKEIKSRIAKIQTDHPNYAKKRLLPHYINSAKLLEVMKKMLTGEVELRPSPIDCRQIMSEIEETGKLILENPMVPRVVYDSDHRFDWNLLASEQSTLPDQRDAQRLPKHSNQGMQGTGVKQSPKATKGNGNKEKQSKQSSQTQAPVKKRRKPNRLKRHLLEGNNKANEKHMDILMKIKKRAKTQILMKKCKNKARLRKETISAEIGHASNSQTNGNVPNFNFLY